MCLMESKNEESKWIPLSNIHDYKLISGLNDVLEVFEGTKYNELYYSSISIKKILDFVVYKQSLFLL